MDGERDEDAGQGRVNARLQHANPDIDAGQQIRRQPGHAANVQKDEGDDAAAASASDVLDSLSV